jgi:hypothetical protein
MDFLDFIILVGGVVLTALLCCACGLGVAVWLAGDGREIRK